MSSTKRAIYSEISKCLVERHPFAPFVRPHTRVVLCGSFLPVRREMDFYYPNTTNDMWKIIGAIFYHDRNYFFREAIFDKNSNNNAANSDMYSTKPVLRQKKVREKRRFDVDKIMQFMEHAPIGFCDVAKVIKRTHNNASDDNLEILEFWDIVNDVLSYAPSCTALVATGSLSCQHLLCQLETHKENQSVFANSKYVKREELETNKGRLENAIMNDQRTQINNADNYNKGNECLSRLGDLTKLAPFFQAGKELSNKITTLSCKEVLIESCELNCNKTAFICKRVKHTKKLPEIGQCVPCLYHIANKLHTTMHTVDVYRAPSTSRAYPLQFEKKLAVYEHIIRKHCPDLL